MDAYSLLIGIIVGGFIVCIAVAIGATMARRLSKGEPIIGSKQDGVYIIKQKEELTAQEKAMEALNESMKEFKASMNVSTDNPVEEIPTEKE